MNAKTTIDAIDVDGIGLVRLPNDWQQSRINRLRGADRHIASLAASAGMSIRQFKELSPDLKQAVWEAYKALMCPSNMDRFAPPQEPGPMFQRGIHRGIAEKVAIGRELIAIKAKLPKGHFGPWVEESGLSRSMAMDCMALAREAGRPQDAPQARQQPRQAAGQPLAA